MGRTLLPDAFDVRDFKKPEASRLFPTSRARHRQLRLPSSNPVSSRTRSPQAKARRTLRCVCIIRNASRIRFSACARRSNQHQKTRSIRRAGSPFPALVLLQLRVPHPLRFSKGGNLERLRHETFSVSASSTSSFLNHPESRSVARRSWETGN